MIEDSHTFDHRYAVAFGLVLTLLVGATVEDASARGYAYRYTGHPSSHYYTNVDGNRVHRPVFNNARPAGATALCGDGSWSFSQHHSGTCSHHGGVANW